MRKNALTDGRRETFYAGLHALLTAGLDFSHAFGLLIDSEREVRMKALLDRLYGEVIGGAALWQAMTTCGAFGALDGGVIRIGEETGRLAEALDFLHGYYRKRREQKRMLSSAVSYPIVILCTAVAVVAFMLAVVVPMFEQVYARMGGELPQLTQAVIAWSEALPRYAAAATGTALAVGGLLYRYRRRDTVQARMAALLLHLPGVGSMLRKNYQARFCKLLYLLTASGVPLLEGMRMLPGVIGFYPYRQSFGAVSRMLEQGVSLAEGLARYPTLYDRRLVALVRVAEETNRLPEMLQREGEVLTAELEERIRRMGTLLEPGLILLVGLLVAVILIAMYMPMFRLGGIMG